MPWVLHMRMRANALRCRFLGYLQLDGEGEGLCLGAASLLMVPVFSCCHTHLHWWDSGARRLVPNPRSRLPTSRPVWFCTSYPLAGKLGVLGLYEPSGVIANRLNDLVYGKIINLCREICVFIIEDGAVGWSCKCSSGRHCRRIGGHRSRDRARPSCSLCHRGYSQTARRRGQDTRVAALEFCVHGIVVHLRLGNCIGYSLREHEWQDRYRSSWH